MFLISDTDYRVHVLRHHVEQMGAADLSAGLYEEPPGVPSGPPRSSVALLQLHVHARGVRRSLILYMILIYSNKSVWLCLGTIVI